MLPLRVRPVMQPVQVDAVAEADEHFGRFEVQADHRNARWVKAELVDSARIVGNCPFIGKSFRGQAVVATEHEYTFWTDVTNRPV